MEGVTTYDYMTNLNIYLNSCSSAADCMLGWGALGYLVLTAHTVVFSTHCSTAFLPHTKQGIHPVMPNLASTAAILSAFIRTHKHELSLFNEFHAVDQACKKVISQLIPDKYYKLLSSWIIGLAKVTCFQILTHLITDYVELEDDDIQEMDRKMKEPISSETIFEQFIEKIEWNQEAVAVQNPYTPAQIVSMTYANIEKCGLYQDDCREWSRKPRLKKNWRKFKAYFVR